MRLSRYCGRAVEERRRSAGAKEAGEGVNLADKGRAPKRERERERLRGTWSGCKHCRDRETGDREDERQSGLAGALLCGEGLVWRKNVRREGADGGGGGSRGKEIERDRDRVGRWPLHARRRGETERERDRERDRERHRERNG